MVKLGTVPLYMSPGHVLVRRGASPATVLLTKLGSPEPPDWGASRMPRRREFSCSQLHMGGTTRFEMLTTRALVPDNGPEHVWCIGGAHRRD